MRLLAIWDLFTILAVFGLTGAFGTGVKGVYVKLGVGLLGLVVIHGVGAYRRTSWLREHPLEVISQLVRASTILAWSGVLVTLALGLHIRFTPLVISWAALPLSWYTGRRIAKLVRRARPERILVVGSGTIARRLVELSRRSGSASVVVGCVHDDGIGSSTPADPPLLGGLEQLTRLLAAGGIDRVIVAFSSHRDYQTLDVLRNCTDYRGAVDIVPRFFDFVGPSVRMYNADGLTLLSVPGRLSGPGWRLLKRTIDIIGASILLVVFSPLLALIALTILLDSGAPVLFRQRRIGMHGRSFSIIKFRTLGPAADRPSKSDPVELTPESIATHVEQAKQEASRRATRVGGYLRKTSLDELPQLFNVLLGQMSLVGPRPLSPLEDAALCGWEVLRRGMRPGITGLWQVSGRSEVSWQNRINLDYTQVRHWSLSSDLHVLADTVRAVVRRRGAE